MPGRTLGPGGLRERSGGEIRSRSLEIWSPFARSPGHIHQHLAFGSQKAGGSEFHVGERVGGDDNNTRNPTLLFRLPGLFLFRFAARSLLAVLFQEPPRTTRDELSQ